MKFSDTPINNINEIIEFASQFDCKAIFKHNAFRILQLPVNASDRDISRRKQVIEISSNTEAPLPDGPCKILPVHQNDNHVDINQIVESLRDPIQRYVQEFFWFWPLSDTKPNDDPAFQALMDIDYAAAQYIWDSQKSDPKRFAIGLHNLAIFSHFSALGLNGSSSMINPEYVNSDWLLTFKYWKELNVLNDFWNLLNNRVREIGDPRLTQYIPNNLRKALFPIVFASVAKEAAILIVGGNTNRAKNILRNIPEVGEEGLILETLRSVTTYNRKRINSLSSIVENGIKSDPANNDGEIETLISEGKKHLNVIRIILPIGAPDYCTTRDNLIEYALSGIDKFYNKTENWEKAIELISPLIEITDSSKYRQEIDTRIKSYNEAAVDQDFWHCKGYYSKDIPTDTFNKLEMARSYFEKQDFEPAIQLLEALQIRNQDQPGFCERVIYPPLATTLNRRAIELLRLGMDDFDNDRPVFKRIIQNLQNKVEVCYQSLYALEKNLVDSFGSRNMLYCMSCCRKIYGGYYYGERNKIKFLICESCHVEDKTLFDSIQQKAKNYVLQSKNLLEKAKNLQPQNNVVKKNLDLVYEILKNVFNISTPQPQNNQTIPPPPKTIPPATTSHNEPKKNKWGCGKIFLLLFFIAIGLFILGLIWNSIVSQQAFTTAPTEKPYPTIIYTPIPTAIPSIVTSTPSCQSWSEITTSDQGKIVCAQGVITKAYWATGNKIFYLAFSSKSGSLRLFIVGGYYYEDILNKCIVIEGDVKVYEGIPMIEIVPGVETNLSSCS